METYKIEIFGEDENKTQRMNEVIKPLENLQNYAIKLLWIDGESEGEEYSVFELQEIIDKQDGIRIDYQQLENLCYKMNTVAEALIIGDKNEKKLFENTEDENIYKNEFVLEFVRNSHWQIITKDISIIEIYKETFPNSKIIE